VVSSIKAATRQLLKQTLLHIFDILATFAYVIVITINLYKCNFNEINDENSFSSSHCVDCLKEFAKQPGYINCVT